MWNPPTGGVPVHDVRLTAASTEGFMLDRPMTDGEAAENASTGGVAGATWCGGSCEGTMQTRLVAWPAIKFCPSPHRRR